MDEQRFWYVYAYYFDANCTKPFYIGKGTKNRDQWWSDYRLNRCKNMLLKAAIKKVTKKLGHVPTKKLFEQLAAKEAENIEVRIQAKIGLYPNGPLLNQRISGNGGQIKGYRHTEEAKKKIGQFHLGRPKSPEHRQKIGASNKLAYQNPELRAQLSALRVDYWKNHPEQLAAMQTNMSRVTSGKNQGTFWVTDGTANKRLKPNQPIPEGWRRGRTYTGLFTAEVRAARSARATARWEAHRAKNRRRH